jgi:hypothetical protein
VPSVTSLLAAVWSSIPLPALLAAAGAELRPIPLDEGWFAGTAIWPKGGRIQLLMPPDRAEVETDGVARDLLARMLGVVLPGQPPLKLIDWN